MCWGALTNFPCELRLIFFSALGVQVHPHHPHWLRLCLFAGIFRISVSTYNFFNFAVFRSLDYGYRFTYEFLVLSCVCIIIFISLIVIILKTLTIVTLSISVNSVQT